MRLTAFFLSYFITINTYASELQFGLLGDAGRWNKNTQMLLNSMNKANVKKIVMPGDNLYEGTYEQQWGPWKKAGFTFDVIAIGNHNQSYASEIKYFQMPGEFFVKEYEGGDIQFIVLNSDNEKNIDVQMSFLKSQLENSRAQQTYIVYHHPTFKVASHDWTEKKQFQLKIRPILKAYRHKITALVLGHDHITALMHFDSLPVIISGCTQSPRNETAVNNVQEGVKVTTSVHLDREPYWVLQQVTSKVLGLDTGEFYFVRGKDTKTVCRATIKTGQPATHSCN